MSKKSAISRSQSYREFRSSVPRQVRRVASPRACWIAFPLLAIQVLVGAGGKNWVYFDLGTKEVDPVIMLHGTSGTADIFYNQIM